MMLGAAVMAAAATSAQANTIYLDLEGQNAPTPLLADAIYHNNPNAATYNTTPGVTTAGINFDYHYAATLNVLSELRAGDFVTVYDFGSYAGFAAAPSADWTISVQPLGVDPGGAPGIAGDGPLNNITFTYHGSTVDANTGPIDLGSFTIRSSNGNPTAAIAYGSLDHQINPPAPSANFNTTFGPSDSGSGNMAPVPAAAWGGFGLLGLLGMGRLVKRRSLIA
jgi:hypothetical protein